MLKTGIYYCLSLFLACSLSSNSYAQSLVQGSVNDIVSGETIVGANISVKGTVQGTLSDPDGAYELKASAAPPFTLVIMALGYQTQEFEVKQKSETINILLYPEAEGEGVIAIAPKVENVVVAPSKVEERTAQSSLNAQKLGLLSIREIPNPDFYTGLRYLPGAQVNVSSLSFASLNTRGFADVQNWRFVQLLDGVDLIGPGLNYPVGNLVGSSELDLRDIELVPGPGSALYGPNVFNGTLVMSTKNPFDYQGLSASVKGGVTVQDAGGTNPFVEGAVRYAQKINDKLAFKFNISYLKATDWTANDQSHYISISDIPNSELLLSRPRTDPNYNAVNMYGDEIVVPVDLVGNGTFTPINRSGIAESDIVDYNIDNIKASAALHYKLTDKVEAIYGYRYTYADAILRHTTIYPLRNINQQIHNLELRSPNFYLRGYYSLEDARDSYQMLATGAFIQEGLKSSAIWSQEYGAAYRGEISGVLAADHSAAREFADRDISGPETALFQELRQLTLNNPDISTGGSKFIDKSTFYHIDGNYDFKEQFPLFSLQIGGSFRKYNLNSEGSLFNDGALGFNTNIPIPEYGAYVQGARQFWDKRITLRGSVRYDKNLNFEGRTTPRGSLVLSFGKNRDQNFRFTAQTGFRNPASQEAYIALNLGEAIILGGTRDNLENFNFDIGQGNLVNGVDIHNQLLTLESFQRFLINGGNDPSLLELAELNYLQQEKITNYEFGYSGAFGDGVKLDLSLYHNQYLNFVTRISTYSLLVNRAFAVYSNIPETIYSTGGTANLEFRLPNEYRFSVNYTHSTFDADSAIANNPGYLAGFNTPKNRIGGTLSNRDIYRGLGFSLHYRWNDAYLWESPFGIGQIPARSQIDAAVFLRLEKIKSVVKIGGSNILGKEYLTVYGGPQIGSTYYLSFVVDDFGFGKK
ncbi:MAG: TonB-dependent receptor [Bacteroidia bacterium]|nr:TonB-dependent receptor [Bacteroidia bacterium]